MKVIDPEKKVEDAIDSEDEPEDKSSKNAKKKKPKAKENLKSRAENTDSDSVKKWNGWRRDHSVCCDRLFPVFPIRGVLCGFM